MEEIPRPENSIEIKKEKTYLYHMVPEDMQGDILHPLNSLKDIHPELYLSKVGKYDDRKHILEQFIPTLKCLWNDVLHLSSVNPKDLQKALVEAGMHPIEMKFYQIDPNLLDPQKTTIYIYPEKGIKDSNNPKDFLEYDSNQLSEHSIISQVTKDYYKEKFSNQEKPLLFLGIPHVLHKGSIDIADLPVITV